MAFSVECHSPQQIWPLRLLPPTVVDQGRLLVLVHRSPRQGDDDHRKVVVPDPSTVVSPFSGGGCHVLLS